MHTFAAALSLFVTACAGTTAETGSTQSTSVADSADVTTTVAQPTTVTGDAGVTTSLPLPRVEVNRADDGSWFEGGWVTTVAVGGPGLIAGGAVGAHPNFTDAAVWTSIDGDNWVRVGDDSTVFGDEVSPGAGDRHQVITDLAPGSLGVVAVGADGRPGDYEAAVWLSSDGLVWERLPFDEEVLGGEGDQIMRSVVQMENSVVVVGESAGHATVWLSDDGREWTRPLIDGAPGGVGPEPGAMVDIALGGPGLVAVGSAGFESRPAVWVSADGSMWSRLPNDTPIGSNGFEIGESTIDRISLVAARGSGLIAIGPTTTGPVAWASVDGFEWRMLETEFMDAPTATHAVVDDVVWNEDRLVAVGHYEGSWWPPLMALWVSVDGGSTWQVGSEQDLVPDAWGISDTPLPNAPHLALFGSSLIVVGGDAVPTDNVINGYVQHSRTVAVWIATLSDG